MEQSRPCSNVEVKRNYYVCETCHVVTCNIATHLKRKCMKGLSKEEVNAALVRARERVFYHIRDHLVVTYDFVQERLSLNEEGVAEVVKLLEDLGHTVTDKPEKLCMEGLGEQLKSSLPAADSPEDNSTSLLEPVESDYLCSGDPVRQKMRLAGVHQFHSITESYIGEFMKDLLAQGKLKEPACRQVIQNVSRLLYFADSSHVNLHSLHPETVQQFFSALSKAGLSRQTRRNYQKSLKRFLGWLSSTNVFSTDESLYLVLRGVEDWLSKCLREELVEGSLRQKKSVEECQVLLRVAANDFGMTIKQSGKIHPSDYVLVLNYLTALMSLKHVQRRSVIENFKVEEWATGVEVRLDDKRFWTFYAKENQAEYEDSKSTPPAAFCLDEEEHMWFQIYFDQFRPIYADKKDAQTEFFFLSTMGKKIHNVANDLNRFHRKYKLGVNTTGEARRSMETCVRARLEGTDLILMEDYLAHSANPDGRFSKFNQPITVCRAMLLMTGQKSQRFETAGKSSFKESSPLLTVEDSGIERTTQSLVIPEVSARNIPAAHYATTNGDLNKSFDKLIEIHAVTLDGKPPSKTLATNFYMIKPKSLIDKWAYAQRALRVQHIKDLFPRRRPRRAEVLKIIQERKWPLSLLTKVIQKWIPSTSRQTSTPIVTLEDRVTQQNWPGLCIGRNQRGNVIFTGKAFSKGEIVVDYHGEVMSFKEGLRRQSEVTKDGYIFFLRHKDLAIDASTEHCKCHPNTVLYGRLISHSRKGKRINLKPETITMRGKTCIVFKAVRDLKAGEELFFDYGVRRKQFNEGHDLSWIDS